MHCFCRLRVQAASIVLKSCYKIALGSVEKKRRKCDNKWQNNHEGIVCAHSLERTTSRRYFTSLRALLVGFQSSNCRSSSSVSALSCVLTKSSSKRPRMIHGRTYGFDDAKGVVSRFGITQGVGCAVLVVSRACTIARSYTAESK